MSHRAQASSNEALAGFPSKDFGMAFSKSKALLFPTPNPILEKAMGLWRLLQSRLFDLC